MVMVDLWSEIILEDLPKGFSFWILMLNIFNIDSIKIHNFFSQQHNDKVFIYIESKNGNGGNGNGRETFNIK